MELPSDRDLQDRLKWLARQLEECDAYLDDSLPGSPNHEVDALEYSPNTCMPTAFSGKSSSRERQYSSKSEDPVLPRSRGKEASATDVHQRLRASSRILERVQRSRPWRQQSVQNEARLPAASADGDVRIQSAASSSRSVPREEKASQRMPPTSSQSVKRETAVEASKGKTTTSPVDTGHKKLVPSAPPGPGTGTRGQPRHRRLGHRARCGASTDSICRREAHSFQNTDAIEEPPECEWCGLADSAGHAARCQLRPAACQYCGQRLACVMLEAHQRSCPSQQALRGRSLESEVTSRSRSMTPNMSREVLTRSRCSTPQLAAEVRAETPRLANENEELCTQVMAQLKKQAADCHRRLEALGVGKCDTSGQPQESEAIQATLSSMDKQLAVVEWSVIGPKPSDELQQSTDSIQSPRSRLHTILRRMEGVSAASTGATVNSLASCPSFAPFTPRPPTHLKAPQVRPPPAAALGLRRLPSAPATPRRRHPVGPLPPLASTAPEPCSRSSSSCGPRRIRSASGSRRVPSTPRKISNPQHASKTEAQAPSEIRGLDAPTAEELRASVAAERQQYIEQRLAARANDLHPPRSAPHPSQSESVAPEMLDTPAGVPTIEELRRQVQQEREEYINRRSAAEPQSHIFDLVGQSRPQESETLSPDAP